MVVHEKLEVWYCPVNGCDYGHRFKNRTTEHIDASHPKAKVAKPLYIREVFSFKLKSGSDTDLKHKIFKLFFRIKRVGP